VCGVVFKETKLIMKKILSIAASAAVLTVAAQLPSQAQSKDSYIGPTILFGSGDTVFGANGKFGIAESISIRPIIAFGSGATAFGASATYDFNLPGQSSTKFEPFAGIGFLTATGAGGSGIAYAQLGTDFGVSDNIVLNADLKIPLSGGGTFFGIGAGFKF
jgi:opacity protein-like surface antigen